MFEKSFQGVQLSMVVSLEESRHKQMGGMGGGLEADGVVGLCYRVSVPDHRFRYLVTSYCVCPMNS